jgi:acetyl-CoA decarbonylase/synthase complex subunit gamma
MAPFLAQKKLPAVVQGTDLDEAYSLVEKLARMDLRDLVLDIPATNAASIVQNNTVSRKSALSGVKNMGYPLINFVTGRNSAAETVADASLCICNYASILVFDRFEPEALLPMVMLRQNIYTDPQKPIQMEPGIYKIGEATENSPLAVTTNFSLTYFIVSGEIESSGVPVWLAITDSEGMSVLTAWAAGKFSAEKIADFLKQKDVAGQMANRRIIIPGYVSGISGELEENMAGWEIMVGPQEASDIVPFMKRLAG